MYLKVYVVVVVEKRFCIEVTMDSEMIEVLLLP